jgi:hypothetical protein
MAPTMTVRSAKAGFFRFERQSLASKLGLLFRDLCLYFGYCRCLGISVL